MMKLAIIVLLVGYAAASGLVSSQRAVIHHTPHHGHGHGYGYGHGYGHGHGVSSRYFDKAVSGHGLGIYGFGYGGLGASYLGGYRAGYLGGYGGNAYDGIDNLGLAYNNYDRADGRLGYAGLGYEYGLY